MFSSTRPHIQRRIEAERAQARRKNIISTVVEAVIVTVLLIAAYLVLVGLTV